MTGMKNMAKEDMTCSVRRRTNNESIRLSRVD
jgi:hypothetical protein